MLALGAIAPVVHGQACDPDLVLHNGRIYTVDPARPWAEALAICGERIVAVGTSADVLAATRPGARRIDLHGRLVVPGFNDSHVHLITGANELVEVDLRSAKNAAEAATRLQGYVKTQPKGRWIRGGFWDHESWPGQQLPTRADIDRLTPDHPVFVLRLDGHMALANSLALKLAGVTRDTPVPDGGAIVKDAAGEPTGVLKDNAMDLVWRVVPPATLDETLTKARAGLAHAARLGVTTIQDMTTDATQFAAYQRLRESGELPVRITSHQNRSIEGLIAAGIHTGFGDDWLRIGGVKLFADGSMGSGTAAFFAPYADDPSTAGLLIQPADVLETQMLAADAAGFQLVVHAIGDKANASVLDILERLQETRSAPTAAPGSSTRRSCATPTRRGLRRPASSPRFSRATASTTCGGRKSGSASRGRPRPTTSSRLSPPACASRLAPTGLSSRSTRCSASTPPSPGSSPTARPTTAGSLKSA